MSKIQILGLALIISASASPLYAQNLINPPGMIESAQNAQKSCEGKTEGATCTYTMVGGEPMDVSGSCISVESYASDGPPTMVLTCQ